MEKIAAALLRVSSNQQELDSQKSVIQKSAKSMGYVIPEEFYFGEKISGGRPQFVKELDKNGKETGYLVPLEDSESLQNLKEACQNPKTSKQIEMIFILEISRLSRKKSLLYTHLEFFKALEKPIYFISHDIMTLKLDTLEVNESAEFMISYLAVYIEEEHRKIRERTQRGKQYAFENDPDRYVGGRMVYGYKVVKRGNKSYIEIDEKEAEIVRLIFDKYVNEKLSYIEIANFLNDKKIPSQRNALWEDSNVGRLLNRENYIGKRKYGKWKGTVPAIISEELFNKVKDILEDKREIFGRRKRDFFYPLKPYIVCGICHNKLQGVTCASRKLYYDEHVTVNNFRADAIIWDALHKNENTQLFLLNRQANKGNTVKEIKNKENLISIQNKKIKDLKTQKLKLLDLVSNNFFTATEIGSKAHQLDKEIKRNEQDNKNLKRQIRYLKESINIQTPTYEELLKMINETNNHLDTLKELLRLFVVEILVHNLTKDWVLLEIKHTYAHRTFCFFYRQSKLNIYYILENDDEYHYSYNSDAEMFIGRPKNNNFKNETLNIWVEDMLKDIDKLKKCEYTFIQEDKFSCTTNDKVKANQKRWNEKYKEKRKQNKLNKINSAKS